MQHAVQSAVALSAPEYKARIRGFLYSLQPTTLKLNAGAGTLLRESGILSFATDGENFTWGSVDEFHTPIPIPPGATHLRFTINNGGSLAAFYAIAPELPNQ